MGIYDPVPGQMSMFDDEFGVIDTNTLSDISDKQLVCHLDQYAADPSDPTYQAICREILNRMSESRTAGKNPFGAGAPKKYSDSDVQKACAMKAEGKSHRQIANELGCSPTTVKHLLERKGVQ